MSFPTPQVKHERFASNPARVWERGAAMYGVAPEKFMQWRWQMKHQVQSASELENILTLSEDQKLAFEKLREHFHAGITPYYIALMLEEPENGPIQLQALPSLRELSDPIGLSDPLQEINNSPVKEVVHVYPDRVAFCVAQLCSVYCRYCFRKRRDEEIGLHFNPRIVQQGIDYIRSNPKIRDVLVTGGDPFIANDASIENLLKELRSIPHVEIIRFGTRVPVTLPYRITPELADMLAEYHPVWVNTHFNCAEELTPDAAAAIDLLLSRGIPVGNQSVLLKGVNDSFERMRDLLQGLIKMRVRPYYLYQCQIVAGTEHLRVPMETGLELIAQLRGSTTGFAIPQFVLDTPSGKVALSPNNVIGREGDAFVVRQRNGNPWHEPNPL